MTAAPPAGPSQQSAQETRTRPEALPSPPTQLNGFSAAGAMCLGGDSSFGDEVKLQSFVEHCCSKFLSILWFCIFLLVSAIVAAVSVHSFAACLERLANAVQVCRKRSFKFVAQAFSADYAINEISCMAMGSPSYTRLCNIITIRYHQWDSCTGAEV